MCAVVGVMFLRTHFVRKSEASDMTTPLTMQPWLGPFARSHLSMSEVAVVERQVENRALSVPARREADQLPEHSPGSTATRTTPLAPTPPLARKLWSSK